MINEFLRLLTVFILLLTGLVSNYCQQDTLLEIDQQTAIEIALSNSNSMKIAELNVSKADLQIKQSRNIQPLELVYRNGELYGPEMGRYLEINQNFGFILKEFKQKELNVIEKSMIESEVNNVKRTVVFQIRSAYSSIQLYKAALTLYSSLEDIAENYKEKIELQYESGEIDLLEKLQELARVAEINKKKLSIEDDLTLSIIVFNQLLGSDTSFTSMPFSTNLYAIEKAGQNSFMAKSGQEARLDLYRAKVEMQKTQYLPEIAAGYFNQQIAADNLWGWQIGIYIPIDFRGMKAAQKEAEIDYNIALQTEDQMVNEKNLEYEKHLFRLNNNFHEVRYLEDHLLPMAMQMKDAAFRRFCSEDITMKSYFENEAKATEIIYEYYQAIDGYNQEAYQVEYYLP